ncbi:MAG TPA: 8-oxo-dGTP diphosphatase [Candidatus Nanoarchaeia archaeon]|nr:8-oxo-dGTP diphosphatase [Candidatus Nanoarchaeia archaeon]
MKVMTLVLLRRDDSLLLGLKKRGFGKGRYNGFGGKVDDGETIEHAAKREVLEEVGVITQSITKVAELTFHFPHKPDWDCIVHIFLNTDWGGEGVESDEMKPAWFPINQLPFDNMWPDDKYWLPHVLDRKFVSGSFVLGEGDVILEKNLTVKELL